MIAEDLKKDDKDGNLPALTVSTFQLWMNASHLRSQFSSTALHLRSKLHLRSHFSFMTSRPLQLLATPLMTCSLAKVVMPAMLALHKSMGSEAALSCFATSCPGWTSNHADVARFFLLIVAHLKVQLLLPPA